MTERKYKTHTNQTGKSKGSVRTEPTADQKWEVIRYCKV